MMKIMPVDQFQPEDFKTPPIQAGNEIEAAVDEIIACVRAKGDQALMEYAARFDKAEISAVEVSEEEIEEAFRACDEGFLDTLRKAKENIWAFHAHQARNSFTVAEENGKVLGQRIIPLKRVGLYVPGGTASYPSSVLMNAIPPKIAGVKEIVITTPPGKDGKVAPAILCAAKIAGVNKIIKSGGAQAVAALAYGTESVPAVDKIVGPGNVYVATAKRRVYGIVDIDMIAGPSEILVLADGKSNPAYVAADLLSQAEHDQLASAILVTDSEELAKAVQAEVEKQLNKLPRQEIARASIENNGKIIVAHDLYQGVEIANLIAPEHLEICVDEPFSYLGAIESAGSVFLGRNAPEALGDYWAGPNHTLPTSGTARFSSPLSVDDFVKKSQFLYYSREALEQAKDHIVSFANREGLSAHANSVAIRFGEEL
ncbi:MAG: histidinol dehydrogenase [Clostridiales bacterium]|nr:histidinol dehydrogenase [Clostridiales bacterium]